MKMNRITIMGVLAALALIMAPGFTAQAASLDGSPDQSVDFSTTAGDIETPDTEVEDDVGEIEASHIEDIDVAHVEDIDVADVGDIETPDIEAPEVEAPEVETPELGE